MREQLTTTQIGARLGISERTVQRWLARGKLQADLLPNGRYAVESTHLDALLMPTLPPLAGAELADRLTTLEARVTALEDKIAMPSPKDAHPLPEPQRRPSGREGKSRYQVPAGAPEGTLPLYVFAREQGIDRRQLLDHLLRHGLDHLAMPSNREGEMKRYVTPEQQRVILAFWDEQGLSRTTARPS